MEQEIIPLIIKQGANLYETISYIGLDKVTPIDLTGYTALMRIRASRSSSEVIKELTSANGGIVFLSRTLAPQIAINILAAETLDAKFIYPSEAVGDLFLISQSGAKDPFLSFQFKLEPSTNT